MTDPKALPVRVKQLQWEWVYEYGCVARAKTNIGTYSLHADEDSASSRMLLFLHLTDDGDCTKYAIEVAARYLDDDEMKAAAQADYEARILSAIEVVEGDVVLNTAHFWSQLGDPSQFNALIAHYAALTKGSTDDRT